MTESAPTLSEDKLRELYFAERASLVASALDASKAYDKSVFTAATASLGFSMVFLKEIVPEPALSTLPTLWWSWFWLVLSIGTIIASFLASQQAHYRQIKILEEEFFDEKQGYTIAGILPP